MSEQVTRLRLRSKDQGLSLDKIRASPFFLQDNFNRTKWSCATALQGALRHGAIVGPEAMSPGVSQARH